MTKIERGLRTCESCAREHTARLVGLLQARHHAHSDQQLRAIRGRIHGAIRLIRAWRRVLAIYRSDTAR